MYQNGNAIVYSGDSLSSHSMSYYRHEDPSPTSMEEVDPILEPVWALNSSNSHDFLDIVLPSDEVILEVMTGPEQPWEDLHHRSYFLPELSHVEKG
jgi:hypothetical protein